MPGARVCKGSFTNVLGPGARVCKGSFTNVLGPGARVCKDSSPMVVLSFIFIKLVGGESHGRDKVGLETGLSPTGRDAQHSRGQGETPSTGVDLLRHAHSAHVHLQSVA
ncbi:hypothetical protein ElyMa_005340900 [Elysia marginata]|uniref:Uncharacterized protein n=1 Tax=Elysia marginata TaxID=1093978 RepID=A0AAV4EA04_9GAST|nr:hypothetical protein ElyMa_005340900 [Elysia marginata]